MADGSLDCMFEYTRLIYDNSLQGYSLFIAWLLVVSPGSCESHKSHEMMGFSVADAVMLHIAIEGIVCNKLRCQAPGIMINRLSSLLR